MSYTALIGLQWGDEGKGRVIDALEKEYDVICRFQGGSNAGHTLYREKEKIIFHQLPSGIIHKDKIGVIGPYEVLDIPLLVREIEELEKRGISLAERLVIDARANLLFQHHKYIDELEEEKEEKIGTTKRGIGPCYRDFAARIGVRLCDLDDERVFSEKIKIQWEWNAMVMGGRYGQPSPSIEKIKEETLENYKKIKKFTGDSVYFIEIQEKQGKRIFLEGAQGTLLDILFGTYPYVTSSHTIAGSASSMLGIPPYKIKRVIGVLKCYTTRVGKGPFPTEIKDEKGDLLREKGEEYGATTGRPRRCGWLDLFLTKYACRINGVTEIALTKIDVLRNISEIKVCVGYKIGGKKISSIPLCISDWYRAEPLFREFKSFEWKEKPRSYEQFPANAKEFIQFVENYLEVPVKLISTGKENDDFVKKE